MESNQPSKTSGYMKEATGTVKGTPSRLGTEPADALALTGLLCPS